MASEAFKPITTIQEPGIQGMPRSYTSTREVSAEWEPPVRGSVLGLSLGSRYKLHIVLSATVQPTGGRLVATIEHCAPSAWTKLLVFADRQTGTGEFFSERQVIPTPTQAQIEAEIFSTFEPIDESKGIKTTKKPRRKNTSGAYVDGYPQQQTKSKGVEDLTPQKFKSLTTTDEVTTVETLAAADVDNIPEPATPTGDIDKIVHKKLNDDQYSKTIITETITANASPLVGEEYGDIVTKSVSEILVADGTAADTGLNIISSTVDPIGNGKSIKQTKSVKGGTWPDPVTKEVTKESGDQVPARYRKDLTRKKTTKKIAVADIPTDPTLSGNQVGKAYAKESPDRAEETITEETLTLDTTALDEAVEQKPFVKITSRMTPGPTSVIPATGNGSSKLVYNGPTQKIYENTAEVAAVRSGPAGTDKEVKPFVSITTAKRYSETPDIATPTGSAQVIFNDGNVQAYEVSEPTSVARPGEKSTEQDSQPWGYIIEKTDYTEGSSPGDGGGSRLIHDDGTVKMYESSRIESLTADGTTKEKDPQQWGTLKWDGQFSTIEDGAADRSKQIFRRGSFKVFHNETASIDVSGGTVDVDPKEWGDVQWDETYDTDQKTGSGKRSRQVFRLGNHVVFLNGTPTLNIIGDAFVSAREENSLLTEVQTSSYSFATNEGVNTRSRVVFALGGQRVYENITIVRTPKGERTYPSVVNVDLPPILNSIGREVVNRRDGQHSYVYTPQLTAGIRGPIGCTVTEYWQQDPNITVEPTVLKPEPVHCKLPATGGLSLPACLHVEFVMQEDYNEHPVYTNGYTTAKFVATEPTTWVGLYYLAHVDSQPYRDGFVIREYRVQL